MPCYDVAWAGAGANLEIKAIILYAIFLTTCGHCGLLATCSTVSRSSINRVLEMKNNKCA